MSKTIRIAAHRGVAGANIPCNTPAAYKIALLRGFLQKREGKNR